MDQRLSQRVRRAIGDLRSNSLVRNATSLSVSSLGTSALGAVFWILAAHLASVHSLGKTAAEITAMVLIANLAQLSYGTMFERFLPVSGRATGKFVANAYRLCIAAGIVLAIAYVSLSWSNAVVPHDLRWRVFFVVSVVLWTIFVLQDSVLVGLSEARWVPYENVAYAALKLAFLPMAIAVSASQGVFIVWIAPIPIAIVGVSIYLFRHRIPHEHRSGATGEELPRNRELIRMAVVQYITMLTWAFLPSILSLIVIQRLGAVANARFYVAALIKDSIYSIVLAIDKSFLVQLSREPARLREHSRVAVKSMAAVVLPSVGIGVMFAPQILRIFGSGYGGPTVTLLRLMLISLVGNAVLVFYSSYAWLDRRVWQLTVRSAGILIINLGYVWVFIRSQGLLSIGIAMVIATSLLTAVFLPLTIRRYRAAPQVA
jgi:O-antigen/teichoic acid export membrane protein